MKQAKIETQNSFPTNAKKRNITDLVLEPGKTKPKRVRSAYNFFFQSERAKMLGLEFSDKKSSLVNGKRKHIRTHGKIGFTDLVKAISMRWNQLDAKSKFGFQLMYEADRKRYHREIQEYDLFLIERIQYSSRFGTGRSRKQDDDNANGCRLKIDTPQNTIVCEVVSSQLPNLSSPNLYEPPATRSSKSFNSAKKYANKAVIRDRETPNAAKKIVFTDSEGQISSDLTDAELELKACLGNEVIAYLGSMEI